jgi:hypothetical protein
VTVAVLTAAFARGAAGLSGAYFIHVKTAEDRLPDRLPNSSVTAIADTPDGYLWVGACNGLARFDGVRLVTFAPEYTPELKVACIRRLVCDVSVKLWICTYDGSPTSYREERFQLEWHDPTHGS